MELLRWIKNKGVFIKFRIGKRPFDPIVDDQQRTTAREDILKKRKERNEKSVLS